MIKKFKLFEYISHYHSNNGDFHLHNRLGIDESESEEIYKQVANFYSDKKLSFLGSGSLGSAFSLDDKVLKITTDRNEIDNIEYLRKKNFHGIVSYYDARKINLYVNGEETSDKIFAIIMDRVETLDEVELECYHLLYRSGFKDVSDNLEFTYTLSCNDIEEKSATNFRKLQNNGERPKKIYELVMSSKDRSDFYLRSGPELGRTVPLEFADLDILQNSDKFQETLFRFYEDILDLLCDVIKYKLSLYDSHEKNVGKDENGHFKMIDLGFRTNRPRAKLKLKPINVYVEREIPEKFMLLMSNDGITFEYAGIYDSYMEAVDDIPGDVEEKNINLNDETILIFYTTTKTYYRIISDREEPEIFKERRWVLQDTNQLSLNLWQNTKSKKS